MWATNNESHLQGVPVWFSHTPQLWPQCVVVVFFFFIKVLTRNKKNCSSPAEHSIQGYGISESRKKEHTVTALMCASVFRVEGASLSDVPQLKLADYQSQPCNTMYSISKQYKEMWQPNRQIGRLREEERETEREKKGRERERETGGERVCF